MMRFASFSPKLFADCLTRKYSPHIKFLKGLSSKKAIPINPVLFLVAYNLFECFIS